MRKAKIKTDDLESKVVVMPCGDVDAAEDYQDEIWAKEAVKEYQKEKHHEYKTLDDLKALLAKRKEEENK